MDHEPDKPDSRRRFLLAGGRLLALGGMATFALGQEVKRRRLTGDPNCVKLYTCDACVEFGRCAKLKAEQFKVSQAGSSSASNS